MAVFGVISTGLAIYRLSPTRGFDIFHVLRSIGSGAVFPPAVMVIFYPVSEHVRALISTQALAVVVMFGGAATVVLTVYALFKPP
jgi:ABC-type transport system involved in cytochrome c biogenesis permease subunit